MKIKEIIFYSVLIISSSINLKATKNWSFQQQLETSGKVTDNITLRTYQEHWFIPSVSGGWGLSGFDQAIDFKVNKHTTISFDAEYFIYKDFPGLLTREFNPEFTIKNYFKIGEKIDTHAFFSGFIRQINDYITSDNSERWASGTLRLGMNLFKYKNVSLQAYNKFYYNFHNNNSYDRNRTQLTLQGKVSDRLSMYLFYRLYTSKVAPGRVWRGAQALGLLFEFFI